MTIHPIKHLLTAAGDIFLPDQCAICSQRLSLNRMKNFQHVPLCSDCFIKAKSAVFSIEYSSIQRCVICGYPLSSEDSLCCRCRDKQWSFSSSNSLYIYRDTGKKLIKAYKFDNRRGLSYFFAEQIYTFYKTLNKTYTITAVPFRPSSKHKRGWDQLEIIVQILKKKYRIPTVKCLKRKNGQAQKKMSYNSRFQNLENKIYLNKNIYLPSSILLIDDVFTTGATMNACSEILRNTGVQNIRCLAIALDL